MKSVGAICLLTAALAVGAAAQDIVGGYGTVSTKGPVIKKAAAVAISDHARKERHPVKLVNIVKAEQQVVSGMNYRLCLRVRRPGHKAHNVTAVVYQPIRRRMRLTDWSEGGCTD